MSAQSNEWGRVAEDGTVFVRVGEQEHAVGQYPEGTPEEALAFFTKRYDALAFEVHLLEQRIRWQTYLQACGATPLTVYYEDLVADRAGTVHRILDALGVEPAGRPALPAPRLRPQSDAATEHLLAQYLAARDRLEPKPESIHWQDDIRRFVRTPD